MRRKPRSQTARQRGMTLLHTVVVMPLIGIFLFIGSKLFISNTQLLKVADQTEEQLLRVDRVIHQMREDAWGARTIDIDGPVLTLNRGDTVIHWTIGDNGTLTRRVAEDEPQHIYELEATQFKRQGGAVILHLAGEQHLCPLGRSVKLAETEASHE